MSLMQLPYELVALVIRGLDLDDIRNLSCTCKGFRFLIQESEMAKRLLEVSSEPARALGKHAHAARASQCSGFLILLVC